MKILFLPKGFHCIFSYRAFLARNGNKNNKNVFIRKQYIKAVAIQSLSPVNGDHLPQVQIKVGFINAGGLPYGMGNRLQVWLSKVSLQQ